MNINKKTVIDTFAFNHSKPYSYSSNAETHDRKISDIHTVRKRVTDPLMIYRHDFETFKEKVADTPMAEIIDTREKFDALVESHSLRQKGKIDEAIGVLVSAGLKSFQTAKNNISAYT